MRPLLPLTLTWLACAPVVVGEDQPAPPVATPPVDDLSLSSLLGLEVSTAGFFPIDPARTPTTSYVIDQTRLERLPALTLGDLIADSVPGMSLGRHGRTGETIGTRGLLIDNNAKTLVLWNGQNLNQRTHFGYHAGLELPLLGDLRGLEVVHGPSSTVYGSGAISGLIGLGTQDGVSRPGVWSRVTGGPMDDLLAAELSLGGAPDADHSWFLYGGFAQAGGVDTSHEQPTSSAGDHAREMDPSGRVSGNARWNTAIGEWRFQALAQRAAIDSAEVQTNPIAEYWRHDLAAARLGWSLPFAGGTSVTVQAPVELHAFQVTTRPGDERGGAEQHGEINAVLRTTLSDHLRLAVGGLGGVRRFACAEGLFDSGPSASFQTMDGHWRETAAFGEVQVEAGPFQIIAGLRWDNYDFDRFTAHDDPTVPNDPSYQPPSMSALSPRVALSYQPADEIAVRASWQRGFRTPDVAYWVLLAWYNEGLAAASLPQRPDVHEETMDSYEFGLSFTAPDRSISLSLNSYWNHYQDLLYFRAYSDADVAAGVIASDVFENMALTRGNRMPGHFINADQEFDAIGAELVLSGQPLTWWGLSTSYGYSRPLGMSGGEAAVLRLTTDDGDAWSRYPTHLVKADSTVLLGQRCDFTLGLRWQSAIEINPQTPLTAESFDHQRTILNARIRWFGREGWQIGLTAQNLLADNTPPVGDSNQYWNGKTGDDQTRVYLHLGWEW